MKDPSPPPPQPISSFVVIARIVAVSGMSIALAGAIFFFVGGIWQVGLPALGLALLFFGIMFLVERAAA